MMIRKQDNWGFLIVWQFRVRPPMKRSFLHAYGNAGEWVRFFSQDRHYIGTELTHDLKTPGTYLTLDFWTSERAYENFKRRNAAGYETIDAKCEALTESEREIGRYLRVRQKN